MSENKGIKQTHKGYTVTLGHVDSGAPECVVLLVRHDS